MVVGILLVQAVAFAVLSGIIASNKNRDAFGWAVIGFIFGLFGFIAAVAVGEVEEDTRSSPRRSARKEGSSHNREQASSRKEHPQSAAQDFDPDEHEKKCPVCAEYIKLEARGCKHCGHEFSEEDVEEKIEEVKREQKRTATQSRREAKRVPDSGEKPHSTSEPSATYSTSDRPDTYTPDTSRTKRWVITLAVIGSIIVIIIAIAIQQAG